MAPVTKWIRLKMNPVEAVVFLVFGIIFANSVYQLFYGWGEWSANSSKNKTTQERLTASIPTKMTPPLLVQCKNSAHQIDSDSVRLKGPLCGKQFLEADITNLSNDLTATVLTDQNNHSFETDYISLVPGTNNIRMIFKSKNGTKTSYQLAIQRTGSKTESRK